MEIGTKVRILSNKYCSEHKIGSIGVVTGVNNINFLVNVDGKEWAHMEDSVKVVDDNVELLEALEVNLDNLLQWKGEEIWNEDDDNAVEVARAAIAKAKGE